MYIFYWIQGGLLDKKLPLISEFDLFRNINPVKFYFFLRELYCYLNIRDIKASLSAENFCSEFAF